MKSRKVVTRSGRGFRGYYPSKKVNRMVEFESLLERDAILLFEKTDEVLNYQEQPTIIYYYLDGVPRKYYPDFAIVLLGDVVVHIEVKPKARLAKTKLSAKFKAISELYKNKSERFVILTDRELRSSENKDFYQLINNCNVRELS